MAVHFTVVTSACIYLLIGAAAVPLRPINTGSLYNAVLTGNSDKSSQMSHEEIPGLTNEGIQLIEGDIRVRGPYAQWLKGMLNQGPSFSGGVNRMTSATFPKPTSLYGKGRPPNGEDNDNYRKGGASYGEVGGASYGEGGASNGGDAFVGRTGGSYGGGFTPYRQSSLPSNVRTHMLRNSVPFPDEQIWTNRIVPYQLDTSFNTTEMHLIRTAINEVMDGTGNCITFVPRTFQKDFIFITNRKQGCWSEVGRAGGNQTVSIAKSCSQKGVVMHELLHALGFWHEHNRMDRDNYINIVYKNIQLDHISDFNINKEARLLNIPYDYYSIMHYRTNTFSLDHSKLDTIVVKDPAVDNNEVGQRKYLSDKDKQRIRALYNCPLRQCSYPEVVPDGRVLVHSITVGANVTYTCTDPAHVLVGASTRTCLYDGSWSGSTPFCFSAQSMPAYCNFEDVSVCGWSQDTTDEADWTRWSGQTDSVHTGPTFDHTEQNSQGYYMYLEGSGVPTDSRARLISPMYPASPNICVLFWYDMYGAGMGNLTVYMKVEGTMTQLKQIAGNQGRGWKMELVPDLHSSVAFQIVFEGTRGPLDSTDLAIDDVMVGSCDDIATYDNAVMHEEKTVNHTCSFDVTMCGWLPNSTDSVTWARHSGPTPSIYTGPSCDRTHCLNGSYVYMEASGSHDGEQAQLVSPPFQGSGNSCLAFFYHMYGVDMGNLAVNLVTQNMTQQVLWNISGDQGDAWQQVQLNFLVQEDFQIVVEATRGDGFKGDIAIDDVAVTSGKCPAAITCDFENGFCDLINAKVNDTFDWTLTRGATMTPSTGPTADHTSGTGYFAFIESSAPRVAGDKAQLETPTVYGSEDGYCLTLWYYMYGADVASLRVLFRHGAGDTILWTETGNKGEHWLMKKVEIPPLNFQFKIAIEAVVGVSFSSDIAIDDVSLEEGLC